MKRLIFICMTVLAMVGSISLSHASSPNVETLTEQAVSLACKQLNMTSEMERACLTNALSAAYQGQSTRKACDVLFKKFAASPGRGNLLPVQEPVGGPLWFAFVGKPGPKTLMMVRIYVENGQLVTDKVLNVYVDKNTSFEPFQNVLKEKAFALVTIANGWADGIPDDLLHGSLFHDHLCCGVCSGYFTVKYIRDQLPLKTGQAYTYIGAPAWCQDDYIMCAMNLTPGKHGYYTMSYPWSRSWNNGTEIFSKLGGILVRYDRRQNNGIADLLSFDWRETEFKAYLGLPEQVLDWKGQPWLHVLYTRFMMTHADHPEYFVSTLKTIKLTGPADLNHLTAMGANPLAWMLGPDKTWNKEMNP